MQPLISVIVPVYNVAKYLPRCIDSILSQSFNNFELILIDDGSPDNCGDICDYYSEKDNRITVIHQPNMGVSTARNHGLDVAKGDYIAFVDSDDYIAPNYLEYLLNLLIHNIDAGFAICSFKRIDEFENQVGVPLPVYATKEITVCDNLDYFTYSNGLIWGTLYKRESLIIDGKLLHFDRNLKNCEDNLYSFLVMLNCKSYVRSCEVLYYYLVRSDSAFHSEFNTAKLGALDARWQMICKSKHFKTLNRYITESYIYLNLTYIENLLSKPDVKKSDLNFMKKHMRRAFIKLLSYKKGLAYKAYYFMLTICPKQTFKYATKYKKG